jgi:hypothetical protein
MQMADCSQSGAIITASVILINSSFLSMASRAPTIVGRHSAEREESFWHKTGAGANPAVQRGAGQKVSAASSNKQRSCDQSCDQIGYETPETKKAHLSVSLSC